MLKTHYKTLSTKNLVYMQELLPISTDTFDMSFSNVISWSLMNQKD